jgi:hypothetical protein
MFPPMEAEIQAGSALLCQYSDLRNSPMGTKRASFVEYAQKILGMEFQENPSSGSVDSAEKVLSSSQVSIINRSKENYIFWACAFSGFGKIPRMETDTAEKYFALLVKRPSLSTDIKQTSTVCSAYMLSARYDVSGISLKWYERYYEKYLVLLNYRPTATKISSLVAHTFFGQTQLQISGLDVIDDEFQHMTKEEIAANCIKVC